MCALILILLVICPHHHWTHQVSCNLILQNGRTRHRTPFGFI